MLPVPMVDLAAQRRRLGDGVDKAIQRVLEHGQFIGGPEVAALEDELAERAGVAHAVGCSSGTDALVLGLMAAGIGPGDAVFVPAFTFAATAEVVVLAGATPVFLDVLPDTFDLDPAALDAALVAPPTGLRPAAVIAVDLFGQPADYTAIEPIARQHGLVLVADAAQSFGATGPAGRVGAVGDLSATSFFPSKPLACYGDGGAVLTDDGDLAEVMRSIRSHGQGAHRYEHVRVGMNGRLDTLQAAVLLEKLEIFDDELRLRHAVAVRYDIGLADIVATPTVREGSTSTWAQYTIQVDDRAAVVEALDRDGIASAVHYPIPLPEQPAYRQHPVGPGGVRVATALAERVLSLPMHPYLDEDAQARVVAAVRGAIG